MSEEAYPLAWPAGWARTANPESAKFKVEFSQARDHLVWEIQRMGGRYIVISTNIPLRRDGLPYVGTAEPRDHGVAVYFERKGKQLVFACDKWDKVKHNMRAIEKTIDAIRGIERWGASDLMERSLQAFEALPAPRNCWHILGMIPWDGKNPPTAAEVVDQINAAYRKRAKNMHPDVGGTEAIMAELNWARDEALKRVEG